MRFWFFGAVLVWSGSALCAGGLPEWEINADRRVFSNIGKSAPAQVVAPRSAPSQASSAQSAGGFDAVSTGAHGRCAARHESYSLQAACVRNERDGWTQWQGSFGMSGEAARAAKSRCAARHESYSLRAACMRNERDGWQQMRSQRR